MKRSLSVATLLVATFTLSLGSINTVYGQRDGLTCDQLDPLLRGLGDVDDFERELLEFLHALNDDAFDRTVPESMPSGLGPGGRI